MKTWRAVYNKINISHLVIFRRSIHRLSNLGSSNVFHIYSERKGVFRLPLLTILQTHAHHLTLMVWHKTAVTPLLTHWSHCKQSCAKPSTWCMGSVWSYCQGGQLPWSIESHSRGQSNHSNHSVPRTTIQVHHYFYHIYRETAVLTQKLTLWGFLWDWVQPTRSRTARAWAPRFHLYTILNVIFKHHTNLSPSIADRFRIVWWHLAQTA